MDGNEASHLLSRETLDDVFAEVLNDSGLENLNLALVAELDDEIAERIQVLSQTSGVKFYSVESALAVYTPGQRIYAPSGGTAVHKTER